MNPDSVIALDGEGGGKEVTHAHAARLKRGGALFLDPSLVCQERKSLEGQEGALKWRPPQRDV